LDCGLWYSKINIMNPVIMCGGIGTKMWPMSRKKLPKHFVPLFEGKSLFQLNVESLTKLFPYEKIFVQTNLEQKSLVNEQAPKIPEKNIFIEPELRNHGPATGFMAAKLYKLDPDEPFVLVQADVLRRPENLFLETIKEIENLILKEKKLVTGGLRPDYAIMGVDYLIAHDNPVKHNSINFYKMEKWLGRDSKEGVEKYLENKAVFTHANHYAWTPKLMLEAIEKHKPDWYIPLTKMIKAFGTDNEKEMVKEEYSKMPKGPIEEVTKLVLEDGYVFEAPFEWIDFGTWESLANYFRIHQKERLLPDETVQIDSRNCFLKLPKGKFGATIGVQDLVIVDSGDALLVCHKDKTGEVGRVVDQLKETKKDNLL